MPDSKNCSESLRLGNLTVLALIGRHLAVWNLGAHAPELGNATADGLSRPLS